MNEYRTSSLFHYTNELSTLISILKSGFEPNYAEEKFFNDEFSIGIPMISFCDIPLSKTAKIITYGNYAIGMTKEWGIANGINPVLYTVNTGFDSAMRNIKILKEIAKDSFDENFKSQNKIQRNGEYGVSVHSTSDTLWKGFVEQNMLSQVERVVFGFSKPYLGAHKGTKITNYNDNEWRFVDIKDWLWGAECFEKWRGDKELPKPKSKFNSLSFSVSDITFILVKTESEIPQMVDNISKMEQVCGKVVSEDEKKYCLQKLSHLKD